MLGDTANEWKHIKPKDTDIVTVCSECLRACCWRGEFMCDDAVSADIIDKTVAELRRLKLEHSDYWRRSIYEAT